MKIFDEKGNELKLGNVIQSISPEIIENIIRKLHDYAIDYDRYEYGLPVHEPKYKSEMSEIIKTVLNQ